jgi:hypothetical protein
LSYREVEWLLCERGIEVEDARNETISSLRVIAAGHALMQNRRRGHHELTVDVPSTTGSESRTQNWPAPSDRCLEVDPATRRLPIDQRNTANSSAR